MNYCSPEALFPGPIILLNSKRYRRPIHVNGIICIGRPVDNDNKMLVGLNGM